MLTIIRAARLAVAALFILAAGPADARVVFTGYSDLRFIPLGAGKIGGSPGILGAFKITQLKTRESGFTIDSLGLFATTYFDDRTSFAVDFTYRDLGFKTKETRLQYAYLQFESENHFFVKAGRMPLPLGVYNDQYFYSFQRKSIEPPIFQSAILGLPIGDLGLMAGKTFGGEPAQITAAIYGINGYGRSDAGDTIFRPGIGSTGGALLLSNNLTGTNRNDNIALGGRLEAAFGESQVMRVGTSLYHGPWSPNSQNDFSMYNLYFHFKTAPLMVLAEFLTTRAENDQGVVAFYGVDDWKSTGFFIESTVRIFERESRALHFFWGAEATTVKGDGGGGGKEIMENYKAGLAWKINEYITLKTELAHLHYELPIAALGGAIEIDRDRLYLNATVSF